MFILCVSREESGSPVNYLYASGFKEPQAIDRGHIDSPKTLNRRMGSMSIFSRGAAHMFKINMINLPCIIKHLYRSHSGTWCALCMYLRTQRAQFRSGVWVYGKPMLYRWMKTTNVLELIARRRRLITYHCQAHLQLCRFSILSFREMYTLSIWCAIISVGDNSCVFCWLLSNQTNQSAFYTLLSWFLSNLETFRPIRF